MKKPRPSKPTRMIIIALLFGLFSGMLWWAWVPSTFTGEQCQWNANAAWIGVEWTTQPVDPQAVAALAHQATTHQLRFLFPFITAMKADGAFETTATPAKTFVRTFRSFNRQTKLLAWIGLPTPAMDVHDQLVRTRVIGQVVALVRAASFDGVHIDAEPIVTGDTDYLRLLEELRTALPPQTLLSVAGLPWMPALQHIATPTNAYRWDSDYYRAIAQRVDQIAVMTYDSHAPHSALYRLWMREQVRGIQRSVANTPINLLIGISLSREGSSSHDPQVETLADGFAGLCAGVMSPQPAAKPVGGVALYALWDATNSDWTIWNRYQQRP